MKAKRANGTFSKKSSTGTWLAYWEKLSGQSAHLCFRQGCINSPSVGALIQKDSPTNNCGSSGNHVEAKAEFFKLLGMRLSPPR